MTWREYHESTKHSVESLRRAQRLLDWANMPDPFRHYEGVPVLDLPADPPAPEVSALEVLQGGSGVNGVNDGPTFLSQLSSKKEKQVVIVIHDKDRRCCSCADGATPGSDY